MNRWIGLFVMCLALTVTGSAGEPDGKAVSELEMISGTWRGADEDTLIEEIWSSAENGMMIGMFRMMSGGEVRFYELMTIEPVDSGWAMYLRHFGSQLEAWEERDGALIFDLVELAEGRAVFDQRGAETNLVYERVDDELTVVLEKMVDGAWKRTPFNYRLVD